jgi:hypothetical protein
MKLAPSGMPESVGIQQQLTSIHIDEWLKDDFLHARWWILLGMILLSALLWLILLDKARLKDIFLFAFLAAILAMALVEYGDELIQWDYPTDIIPVFPPLTSINLFILPLALSLVYQYFRTWKSFFLAALAASSAISFVVEPLLAWGDFYQLINWHYLFSFPVYVALAMFTRWLVLKINAITDRNKRTIRVDPVR